MSEKERKKTYKIHPQLEETYRIVGMTIGQQIGSKLQEAGLVNIVDDDWEPKGKLTEEGLDILIKNFGTALGVAIARARVSVPPGYALDQLTLADNMIKGFGEVDLKLTGNDIRVGFSGEGALVESITSPLDIDEALRQKPDGDTTICQVKIGRRPRIIFSSVDDWHNPEHTA